MFKRGDQIARIVIAATLFTLAVVRLIYHSALAGRMDTVFFILVGAGLLLILVPVQYLKSFKAGGLEFSLDRPQIEGAISGLGLDRIQDEKLRARLSRLQEQLGAVRGSRVLWIDDHPHGVVAERRLLRALGVEVLTAISSDAAEAILYNDNDFDLIITDVQRQGDSHRLIGGVAIHEGANFIVKLRLQHPDPVIKTLPTLFYAAYDWERLVAFTLPARVLYPTPELANTAIDLIPKAIKLLAESRATPIPTRDMKKPTPTIVGGGYGAYKGYGQQGEHSGVEEEDHSGGEEEEHFNEEERKE